MQPTDKPEPVNESAPQATVQRDLNDPDATFADLPFKPVLTKSQSTRANQTFKGMVLSLLFTLAAVIPILLLNPMNSGESVDRSVDLQEVAQQAEPIADFTVWAPSLGEGEYANFARWKTSPVENVSYWEFGLVLQEKDFVWVRQTADSNPSWLANLTDNAPPTRQDTIDGGQWETREKDGQTYMISERADSTLILSSDTSPEQLMNIVKLAEQQVQ